jgi:arylsulfatase A-like enzyme
MPDVLDWIAARTGVRFFLYLYLVDPHTPHDPDPEALARIGARRPADFPNKGMDHYTAKLAGADWPPEVDLLVPPEHQRWIVDQYDASVATGDRWLGALFDRLDELGLEESTVIAFTADHGEELFDHGGLEHGHGLHRELVHVPLLLAGPGIERGARIERVVSNRHLAPTLARFGGTRLEQVSDAEDLLGGSGSDMAQFQTGKGLWPARQGTGGVGFPLDRKQQLDGLRVGSEVLHLRRPRGRNFEESDAHLYDLGPDPGELRELGALRVDRRRELYLLLSRKLAQQRLLAADLPRIGTSESVSELIREVGYGGSEDEDP